MSSPIFKEVKQQLCRFYAVQAVLLLTISVLFLVFIGERAGFSAICGGVSYLLPMSVFTWMMFAKDDVRFVGTILRNFYFGEVVKYALTIILFCVAFAVIKVGFMPFFASYVILQFGHWFMPWVLKANRRSAC